MPPRTTLLALWLVASTAVACDRTTPNAGTEGPARPASASPGLAPPASALAPPPSTTAPPTASADGQPPKPADSADDPPPAGSVPRDPGRLRAPVIMTLRGGPPAQPSPIVVTIDVREPVQAPATLALGYSLADGTLGRKSLPVSLAAVGTQTHSVALDAAARGPVRVTLDASDPAHGTGLHAERSWPETAAPTPSRPPGPPGGRPPSPPPRP